MDDAEDDRRPLVRDEEWGIHGQSASAGHSLRGTDTQVGVTEVELQNVGSVDVAHQEVMEEVHERSTKRPKLKRGWLTSCGSRLWACSEICRRGSSRDEAMLPFYPIDSTPSWATSIFMGLQHAMAMAAGIVSIPIVISGKTAFQLPTPDTQYLISVGLMMSGVSSMMQVHRFKLPFGKFLGTGESDAFSYSNSTGLQLILHHHAGMISICGTSFTFVPIAQAAARLIMQEDSTIPCTQDEDCLLSWADAAGSAIPGVSNIGQCNDASGRCRRSGVDCSITSAVPYF